MEENTNWDIEEFKTKFESEEHWDLKREFMIKHKEKFSKERLVCLAQVFANIQLLRCKYPDALMRQVAELSKGIGKDFKTKQRERLQRTFVKASDAASAKVRGEKRKRESQPPSQGPPSKISFVKEKTCDSESSMSTGLKRTYSQASLEGSSTSFVSETPSDSPSMSTGTSPVQSNKYLKALKTSDQRERSPVLSPKITAIKYATQTPKVPVKRTDPSLEINPEDPFTANLLLVYRSFLNIPNYMAFLKGSVEFSRFLLNEDLHKENGMWICTLTVRVRGKILTLGTGEAESPKWAKSIASKDAVENMLSRCYTIEIKKRASVNEEEISLDNLVGVPQQDERIANDNVGSKMLKLMGWSGGALGKTGVGITEPVKAVNIIGRQGLGIRDEQRPTFNFKKKVRHVLDSIVASISREPNGVIPGTAFSSELSNEQRKHIHLIVRKEYPQLKSISYGKHVDRYLVIKPKLDSMSLFEKVSSHGGLTDQYEIHRPGTLSSETVAKMSK